MSILTAHDLAISFLGRTIFEGVGFQLAAGDRVGLIGPNGAGKTTLLRLMVGEQAPDRGEVTTPKGTRVGYLPQDLQETLEGSVIDSVLTSVAGREELEERTVARQAELEAATCDEERNRVGTELAELHAELGDLEARFPRHRAERILAGLGFDPQALDRPVTELSGGWKMRAALSSLLYQQPDVLLLDEPTNHLDIPSVHWLEGFLQGFPGAIMLISHDRDFLDRQVRRVLSLEPEGLRAYRGNYTSYLKLRQEEEVLLENTARKQEQKVKEARRFIDRFRAKASKARQAQSKLKLLDKMDLVETHQGRKQVRFRFPEVERAGRVVLTLDGVSKAYGQNRLYQGLDLAVQRGERIAVIGPIGSGKTTLLRIVSGEIPADGGKVNLGHGVSMAYYAQHQVESLNLQLSVVEEVQRAIPGASQTQVRGICGAFLFSGDDVDKTVGVLSGGEKARVSLAKLLVSRANLMVMDEPTNHLDLHSTEVLVEALRDYQGTLLFVSHNQAFVNRLATRIWEIQDGTLTEYPGNLDEYYAFLERREDAPGGEDDSGEAPGPGRAGRAAAAAAPEPLAGVDRKEARRARAEERKRRQGRLGPLKKRVGDLEVRIGKLESRESELSGQLADPALFQDKERSVPILKEHGEVRKKLDELMARWEHATEEFEAAQAELDAG